MESLTAVPDFASITWLASKVQVYSQSHPMATGIKGAAYIGRGATFSVYRSRRYKDKVFAIKQPRLVFEDTEDEVSTMRQLYSLHLELRVLTDPRIRAHENITKLESIVWEEHSDDSGRLWPSLVMEYADMGTLSDLFDRGLDMPIQDEKRLCFTIGAALAHLHENGVIHGDIKPGNVLMFSAGDSTTFIPKLSDFGFSIFDEDSLLEPPLGTADWEAPEILDRSFSRQHMRLSDAYSFGLLSWCIASGGKKPFMNLKQISGLSDLTEIRAATRSLKLTKSIPELASGTLAPYKQFYSEIFQLTLKRDPVSRDLAGALLHLREDGCVPPLTSRETSNVDNSETRTLPNKFNVRELKHLGARIQNQILCSLEKRATHSNQYNSVQRAEASMAVAQSCLESFGGRKPGKALDWILLAATLGHKIAKALAYRVATSLGLFSERKDEVLTHIIECAEDGIVIAMDDLMVVDQKMGEAISKKVWNRRRHQCFGDTSLDLVLPLPNKLPMDEHGETVVHKAASCGDVTWLDRIIQAAPESRATLLNSRNNYGETPLLLAFMARELSTVELLLNYGADASIPDDRGDTPLHWIFFFDDVSSLDSLTISLIQRGGDINAHTKTVWFEKFSQKLLSGGTPLHRAAAYNSSNSVRALLEQGSDPLLPGVWDELSTPLWLACTFQCGKAVRVMLDHMARNRDISAILNDGDRKKWPFLKPVLDQGYYFRHGATLGRMARYGAYFKASTSDTISALQNHGASMILPAVTLHPYLKGMPAISSAIQLRCADIVETILELSPDTCGLFDSVKEQSPLHFAVEQDRSDLVEILLRRDIDVYARNRHGISALANYANYHGGLEIPRTLIRAGLKFEIPRNKYQTPFFGAITHAAFDLAVFILSETAPEDRHAMINAPAAFGPAFKTSAPGYTVLGYLLSDIHQNTPRLLERLINILRPFDQKLDYIIAPGEGLTALHILATQSRHDRIDSVTAAVARMIIEHCMVANGIDYVEKQSKRSALWYAIATTNYDLVTIFLRAGSDPNLADRNGISPLDVLRNQAQYTTGESGPVQEITKLFNF
ncbi:hypothetical protein FNYG_15298 [Fusarium nygamai]|uniref:Protein kinase domain-containing protein n=1 Tax=Gibberella nygamai TaxID=42673 RepID=A0A2K0UGQ6_GIBNY|nr:hypothetical protein FNYG_15298 [Fusarium nygamai]